LYLELPKHAVHKSVGNDNHEIMFASDKCFEVSAIARRDRNSRKKALPSPPYLEFFAVFAKISYLWNAKLRLGRH